jgi:hypothetical protein
MKYLIVALAFCVTSNCLALLYLNWRVNKVMEEVKQQKEDFSNHYHQK